MLRLKLNCDSFRMGFYDEDDVFCDIPEYDRGPQQPEPKRLRLNEPGTSWASEVGLFLVTLFLLVYQFSLTNSSYCTVVWSN